MILPNLSREFLAPVAGVDKFDTAGHAKDLLPLAVAAVLASVVAPAGLAAGSTKAEHFSDTFPADECGFSGTLAVRGTPVFRDAGNGVVDVYQYAGDSNDPVGDFISETCLGYMGRIRIS